MGWSGSVACDVLGVPVNPVNRVNNTVFVSRRKNQSGAIDSIATHACDLRWRGWRIWAGTVSWLTIVIIVVEFGQNTYKSMSVDFWTLIFFTIAILVCIFVLWAKRQDKALALQTGA
jgi:hypothetical protein